MEDRFRTGGGGAAQRLNEYHPSFFVGLLYVVHVDTYCNRLVGWIICSYIGVLAGKLFATVAHGRVCVVRTHHSLWALQFLLSTRRYNYWGILRYTAGNSPCPTHLEREGERERCFIRHQNKRYFSSRRLTACRPVVVVQDIQSTCTSAES